MKSKILLLLLLSLSAGFGGVMFGQGIELKNITAINTEEFDFYAVPFNNGVVFTSSKAKSFLRCPADNAGDYTDLMYAPKNADGSYGEPSKLKGDVNGKYNDGVATFNPVGNKMIFSRNTYKKNDRDSMLLKVYSADLVGDAWENVTELPFNLEYYSSCHPALSKDGSLLIFASDRPGSLGGMDLWGSRWENGTWTQPFNLGSSVNSAGNDVWPFLDENNNLFFSSNGHGGAGGLDVFSAKMNAGGSWEMLGNLGAPFNQAGDEVAFSAWNNGTEGYLTSDRANDQAKGKDDIYHWTNTPDLDTVVILVVDKATNEPLPDADVNINITSTTSMLDKMYGGANEAAKLGSHKTGRDGKVTLMVPKGAEMVISTSKTDYKADRRTVTSAQLSATQPYVIPLEKSLFEAELEILVVEDPSQKPIPLADIKLLDKTTGKVVSLTGDGEGTARTKIDCSHQYEVTASKRPYYDNTVSLKDLQIDCKDGKVRIIVPLKAPLEVILEPIFFDFDRSYIRKADAAPTLDSLVFIMKQYPTLHVRLGAHCDARGTNAYNEGLGQRRADSAKKYLIGKGIAAARISTEQFGERNPINNCTDKVFCTEPQHQMNRRVDVDPERHQEPGVTFKKKEIKVGK